MRLGQWMGRSRCALVVAMTASACGGEIEPGYDEFDEGTGADSGVSGAGQNGGGRAGDGNVLGGRGGTGSAGTPGGGIAGTGGSAGYEDPGCPPQDPLPRQEECDLFNEPSGCPSGLSCYPFVQYPTEPCGQELYGTLCDVGGTGEQGEPCYGEPCAGGHVCVITGQGTQCVQVCPLVGDDGCPPGLVCVAVDVEGVGACF